MKANDFNDTQNVEKKAEPRTQMAVALCIAQTSTNPVNKAVEKAEERP